MNKIMKTINNKLKTFLIGGIGMGLVLLLLMPIAQTLQAHDAVKNELMNSGVDYIYIYNRKDGSPDVITIIGKNDELLEIICSADGVNRVFVNNTRYICNLD